MKYLFLFLNFLLVQSLSAQFFYNDIIVNKEGNKQFERLTKLGIKKIKALNYLTDNQLAEGFFIEQAVDSVAQTLTTVTRIPNRTDAKQISYFKNNLLQKTFETNNIIEINNVFNYDANQLLTSVHSLTNDTTIDYSNAEVHFWQYNAAKKPIKMLKVKNNIDSTTVELRFDENGQVSEEHWFVKNREIEVYFYYYDKNLLTDIVRYNPFKKKLTPEFVFEYNEQNQITQMTQFRQGGNEFFIWKYSYLPNGLKEKEICFDSNENFVGKVVYQYE